MSVEVYYVAGFEVTVLFWNNGDCTVLTTKPI